MRNSIPPHTKILINYIYTQTSAAAVPFQTISIMCVLRGAGNGFGMCQWKNINEQSVIGKRGERSIRSL